MSMDSNKKKKNILMLNYEFPPLGGGAGNATYYLLKEFSKYPNLDIDLVTASVNDYKVERFAENITVHFLDIHKNNRDLHYQNNRDLILYSFKAYWYSRKLRARKTYNLCHAFFGIPCGFVALLLGLPYIVSLRGSDIPFYNNRFYWMDKLVFKKLSKKVWGKAVVVIANSEGLKELAKTTAPDQEIAVIYNGVDFNEFYPANNKVLNEKIKLISTGRLIERKGYAYLIKALEGNKKVELTLIGDGNLKGELNDLAVECGVDVKIPGMVAHDEIPDYLRNADVFVLPSLNEGMSNSVLEAMACGLPIITTNTGGSKELINGNGFVINKNSILDLKKALDQYLYYKNLIKVHSGKSIKIAEGMSWGAIAKQYKQQYGE